MTPRPRPAADPPGGPGRPGGLWGQVLLVKWGGSLITDKRRPETARGGQIRRLAGELAAAFAERPAGAPLVLLGHGSGSFGHVAAERAGFGSKPLGPDAAAGVAATQAAARELHRRVVAALAAAGAAPFSVAAGSALVAAAGRPAGWDVEPVARALALGLVPVVFGDVVLDRRWGAAICSTETLFSELAARLPGAGFRVTRALWLGDTPGVRDAEGRPLAEVDPGDLAAVERALDAARGAAATDVTGGMHHRLETALALAALGVESWIADGTVPGLIARALSGEPAGEPLPGTRVRALPAG